MLPFYVALVTFTASVLVLWCCWLVTETAADLWTRGPIFKG